MAQSGGGPLGGIRSATASLALARARAEYARLQEEESTHMATIPFAERLALSNSTDERGSSQSSLAAEGGCRTRGGLSEAAAEKLQRTRQLGAQLRSDRSGGQAADAVGSTSLGTEAASPKRAAPAARTPMHEAGGSQPLADCPRQFNSDFALLEMEMLPRTALMGTQTAQMCPSKLWERSSDRLYLLWRDQSTHVLLVSGLVLGLTLGTLLILPLVLSGLAGDEPVPGLLNALSASLWFAWTWMADPGAHAAHLENASAWAKCVGVALAILGITLGSLFLALVVEAVRSRETSLPTNTSTSKLLATASAERAINEVLLNLLHSGGSQMRERPYSELQSEMSGRRPDSLSFCDLSILLREGGDILVGYKRYGELQPVFNPKDTRAPLSLSAGDSVVVFS
eukprot:CAMPEP_0180021620 /NCGR_PEP_ID=MMETSP0984-20121128/22421_1 /TAXON_ID=483367 /ORGANISM="non described non described, Strain CCMP 2436" /LENGTH=398 /DNA_ID=CAMNT_0021945601 /DNA_START=60 /DNA_END=1253 /DNA_ORIENTATION=-